MVFLAEIDGNNLCVGVKQTKEFIDDGRHVIIDTLSSDYLWRKYENGVWSNHTYPSIEMDEVPQMTTEDKINFIYYKTKGVI